MPIYRRKFAKKTGRSRKGLPFKPTRSIVPYGSFHSKPGYGVPANPVPARLRTQMQYAVYSALGGGSLAGLAQAHVYRGNSIYDPQFALGGRTVVGHANMANLYGNYIVTGVKVEVTFTSPSEDNTWVGVRMRVNNNHQAAGNSMQDIAEKPLTVFKAMNTQSGQSAKIECKFKPWELMAVSKQSYMDDINYSSVISSNPPIDNCKFDVFSINPSLNGASVGYILRVWYDVTLFNRIGQTSSLLA